MADYKIIPDTGGNYLISSDGEIYSKLSKKHMKPKHTKDGYCYTGLRVNGKSIWVRFHRLVAEAFVPNPHGYETVNHINGNKDDNRAENLEWMNRHEQLLHAYRLGLKKPTRGIYNGNAKLTQEQAEQIRKEYVPHSREHGTVALGRKYGLTNAAVGRIVRGIAYVGTRDS